MSRLNWSSRNAIQRNAHVRHEALVGALKLPVVDINEVFADEVYRAFVPEDVEQKLRSVPAEFLSYERDLTVHVEGGGIITVAFQQPRPVPRQERFGRAHKLTDEALAARLADAIKENRKPVALVRELDDCVSVMVASELSVGPLLKVCPVLRQDVPPHLIPKYSRAAPGRSTTDNATRYGALLASLAERADPL